MFKMNGPGLPGGNGFLHHTPRLLVLFAHKQDPGIGIKVGRVCGMVLNQRSSHFFSLLRKENLEKAEKMAAALIKNHPTNSSYLDTYAWVLFMRVKYKEARRVMEKAIATGQAGAVHFEHYGDILFQLDNIDEAVKQWQKAKTLDNGNTLIDKKIANRKLY